MRQKRLGDGSANMRDFGLTKPGRDLPCPAQHLFCDVSLIPNLPLDQPPACHLQSHPQPRHMTSPSRAEADGWLKKKGILSWSNRYFQLRNGRLQYSHDDTGTMTKVVTLAGLTVYPTQRAFSPRPALEPPGWLLLFWCSNFFYLICPVVLSSCCFCLASVHIRPCIARPLSWRVLAFGWGNSS